MNDVIAAALNTVRQYANGGNIEPELPIDVPISTDDAFSKGWYVHGRAKDKLVNNTNMLQATQDIDVANQYGKNGSAYFLKPNDKARVMDFSSPYSDDMNNVVSEALNDHLKGKLPFYKDIENSSWGKPSLEDIENHVRSSFAPGKIVESAQAYDNPLWHNWLKKKFSPDWVKTPDGAVSFGHNKGTVNKVKAQVDKDKNYQFPNANKKMTKENRNGFFNGGNPAQPSQLEQPKQPENKWPSVKVHVGPIRAPVAGRTDHLPIHVPSGSYVLPADIISGLGEGNTEAGFKVAQSLFAQPFYGAQKPGSDEPYGGGPIPYGQPEPHKGSGGAVGDPVPIVAAGGEFVIHPDAVMHLGNGSLDDGHKILDEFVIQFRDELIKTLSKLPGPQKN